jgi:hypothetical protein
MGTIPVENIDLPKGFYLLKEAGSSDPDDPNRPNRLCICFSDLHFTDGTVGNQSADDVVWEEVFDNIVDLCGHFNIDELTIVLVGDVVDMIRTQRWAEHGVYPWQRQDPQFKKILHEILQGIIEVHTRPRTPGKKTGFFHLLKEFQGAPEQYSFKSERNENKPCRAKVRTLVLFGNHDKEILADDEALKLFYEKCLNQPVETLSDDYRRWIGKMYFDNENHYFDRSSVPWLPFYWADRGFRLLVTHGQWRDQDNSRSFSVQGSEPGWTVGDGWQLDVWRSMAYKPFTEACFGDTVAAGLLSGFIFRAKKRLAAMEIDLHALNPYQEKSIRRLEKVLEELDLYRPTFTAIQRIIEETQKLRKEDKCLSQVRKIIEDELLNSVHGWLSWDFTFDSAPATRRWILRTAKPLMNMLKLLNARIELGFIYVVMRLLAKLQKWQRSAPSYKEMLAFPSFLDEYRNYGFRIHGEGHTHIPLEEELDFDMPEKSQNYTYINFGTWRDQMLPKLKHGYRRRGIGRALILFDKAAEGPNGPRNFSYWVQDLVSWGDRQDKL